jgi:hypothetical protein
VAYLGDFEPGQTVHGDFWTGSGGELFALVGGVISVYKNGDAAQSVAGVTLTTDFDGVTGSHHWSIDLSADGTFYAAGDFSVRLTAGTVLGVSQAGKVLDVFSINNRSSRLNWAAIRNQAATANLSGTTLKAITDIVIANVTQLNSSSTALLKLAAAAGTIVLGAAVAGTLSTTEMTCDLTETTNEHFKGRLLIWLDGPLANQVTDVTAYDGASTPKKLTFTAVTEAMGAGNLFALL